MNQDLTQELAEAQAELVASKEATARAEAKIAAVQAELAKPMSWERWKPGHEEKYYCVNSLGKAEPTHWLSWKSDHDRYGCGNCFPTEKAAERHAKRLRSMVPTCPVPKVGEEVWCVDWDGVPFRICWDGSGRHVALYLQGRIKQTRNECDAWYEEFSWAWATLEANS